MNIKEENIIEETEGDCKHTVENTVEDACKYAISDYSGDSEIRINENVNVTSAEVKVNVYILILSNINKTIKKSYTFRKYEDEYTYNLKIMMFENYDKLKVFASENQKEKLYTQTKIQVTEYENQGFRNHVYANLDLNWLKFYLMNETEIHKISGNLDEISKKSEIYPKPCYLFEFLKYCKPKDIRVLFLSDYPESVDTLDGLAFSDLQTITPSLLNIYKSLKNENIPYKNTSNLSKLAKQGVFLLNSISLTIEKESCNIHDLIWKQLLLNLVKFIITSRMNKNIIVVYFGEKPYNRYKRIIKHLCNENSITLKDYFVANPKAKEVNRKPFFFCHNIFSNINNDLNELGEPTIKYNL